jgi:integrase
MASVYKPPGRKKYIIEYFDENGDRRRKTGATDKAVTERLARDIENRVLLRREGLIDPKDESYKGHRAKPLADHVTAWQVDLVAQGFTVKHADHTSNRVRRLIAVMLGSADALLDHRRLAPKDRGDVARRIADVIAPARLSDLTRQRVQDGIARLRDAGSSLQTCNHYRAAIKAFSKWCLDAELIREDVLRGVTGFNVQEDRRHDRRTISLDELRRLIAVAERGPVVMGMTGPVRALCYRLAVATGLRYAEISSITPESFDWNAPSVAVAAAYTKNGQNAKLPLPDDLVDDLRPYVDSFASGSPVFPLPKEKGAELLQADLAVAGIAYQDASGLFFDFHSLRCQMATNADAAGVSPRVVQRLMRHSTLELTGRYTRPRAVDIENAASMLPSLKPTGDKPESLAMTGTDPSPVSNLVTPQNATCGNVDGYNALSGKEVMSIDKRSAKPPSPVRIRAAPLSDTTRHDQPKPFTSQQLRLRHPRTFRLRGRGHAPA